MRNIGLGIRSNHWEELEQNDSILHGGFIELRIGRGIRQHRSEGTSSQSRLARQMMRPTECPRCHYKFSGRGVGVNRGIPKVWLSGFQGSRVRYKCSVCERKFNGEWSAEFPKPMRPIKHGRARYNHYHCRCEVCCAVMRRVEREKKRRKRLRLRTVVSEPTTLTDNATAAAL